MKTLAARITRRFELRHAQALGLAPTRCHGCPKIIQAGQGYRSGGARYCTTECDESFHDAMAW